MLNAWYGMGVTTQTLPPAVQVPNTPAPAAAPAKKKGKPKPPVEIRPVEKSQYALPKWTPYALGAVGVITIGIILFTAKGKD